MKIKEFLKKWKWVIIYGIVGGLYAFGFISLQYSSMNMSTKWILALLFMPVMISSINLDKMLSVNLKILDTTVFVLWILIGVFIGFMISLVIKRKNEKRKNTQ